MPLFIKTCSFATTRAFDSNKDDRVVNSTLERLQHAGARIAEITFRTAGTENYVVATYMIVYEAISPIL